MISIYYGDDISIDWDYEFNDLWGNYTWLDKIIERRAPGIFHWDNIQDFLNQLRAT
jgi:hypothetical protein